MSDKITPILMPKWGLSMKSGTLSAWHVAEGTEIVPGDEIMDIETDKIANAVEASDGGLLRRRVGREGEVYPVRALLGLMAPESVPDSEIDAYIDAYEMPEIEEDEDEGLVDQIVELGIGRIRYSERAGEGTPIVLIHGFGGDLDNWLFNMDALAESAPVYALDLPGHGQSVKVVDEPGLTTLVAAVIEFLDHLGITKAHLVGHSLGGLIAGRIALDDSERVQSLTLICSAGLGTEINLDYIDGFVAAASRRDLKPVLRHLFADEGLVTRSMVNDLLKFKRIDGVQAYLESLRDDVFGGGQQSVHVSDQLGQLGIPVQVIWGAEDGIIPQAHAAAIAGANVTILPNAGHMVMMECASEVNDLITSQL